MKKKKNIVILIGLIAIISIAIIILLNIKKTPNKENNTEKLVDEAKTTIEERNLWNDFLIQNPYLSKITISENEYIDQTVLLNLAISTKNIDKEFISDKEVELNPLL